MDNIITAEFKSEEKYTRLLIDFTDINNKDKILKVINDKVIKSDKLCIYNVDRCKNGNCIAVEYNNCNRREINTIFSDIVKTLGITEIYN